MPESRMFDLGDILSITDGHLVSPRHIDGVYDILGFMTGDKLWTHQLPRAMRACKPALLAQHPQLAGVNGEHVSASNWGGWLRDLKTVFGDSLPVAPLAPQTWTSIDPVSEAEALVGKDRVITVQP